MKYRGPATSSKGKLIRKNVPWMTTEERRNFERLRAGGAVSFFRVQLCARPGCEKEVPKVVNPEAPPPGAIPTPEKPYCSQACHDRHAPPDEEDDGEE